MPRTTHQDGLLRTLTTLTIQQGYRPHQALVYPGETSGSQFWNSGAVD